MAWRMQPDIPREITLNATGWRHHEDSACQDHAALRKIANGRADLLTAAAGHLGGHLATPGMWHPATVTIAGHLVQAESDPTRGDRAEVARARKYATTSGLWVDPEGQLANSTGD